MSELPKSKHIMCALIGVIVVVGVIFYISTMEDKKYDDVEFELLPSEQKCDECRCDAPVPSKAPVSAQVAQEVTAQLPAQVAQAVAEQLPAHVAAQLPSTVDAQLPATVAATVKEGYKYISPALRSMEGLYIPKERFITYAKPVERFVPAPSMKDQTNIMRGSRVSKTMNSMAGFNPESPFINYSQ